MDHSFHAPSSWFDELAVGWHVRAALEGRDHVLEIRIGLLVQIGALCVAGALLVGTLPSTGRAITSTASTTRRC